MSDESSNQVSTIMKKCEVAGSREVRKAKRRRSEAKAKSRENVGRKNSRKSPFGDNLTRKTTDGSCWYGHGNTPSSPVPLQVVSHQPPVIRSYGHTVIRPFPVS